MSLQNIISEAKTLSADEQKQLIKVLVDMLTAPQHGTEAKPRHLRELRGLGKEIWAEIDSQEYIHQLRDEWDSRS